MTRVGLLGGAFNPPHNGHLRLARLALEHLCLDELRFVPTATSPHKQVNGDPGPDTRLRLLTEALAGFDPRCRIETLELERGGISYTVDTLECLATREPEAQWILLMGGDQLAGLAQWRQADRIFQLASAAVAPRPGAPLPPMTIPGLVAVPLWSGRPGELVILPGTELDLASTDLRTHLSALPTEDPVGLPAEVLITIRSENLYR